MYQNHQNLLKKSIIEIQKQIPTSRCFERHVGLFYTSRNTPIRINIKGMADLYLLVTINNVLVHVEVEIKSGSGKQTKEQKNWQKFIESMEGIYVIIGDDYKKDIVKLKEKLDGFKTKSNGGNATALVP